MCQCDEQAKMLKQNEFIVLVDPSGGYRGVHNSSVLDLLTNYQCGNSRGDTQDIKVQLGAAVNKRITAQCRKNLEAAGVHVLPAFELDGYQLGRQIEDPDRIMPYIAALGAEFAAMFEALRLRWPAGKIHLLYHTMSWEHVMALVSALRSSKAGQAMIHHVFLMYWPGIDEGGITTNIDLKMRYKVALSNFRNSQSVRFYTSTVEYSKAYQAITGDNPHFGLHPFFLDDWQRPASKTEPFKFKAVRKILAYSGDVRMVKGFNELPALIDQLLKAFPTTEELIVHLTTRSTEVAKQFQATYQAIASQAKKDRRIIIIHKFMATEEMTELMESIDLLVLNYKEDLYKNKTSGFLWLAARFGTACVVPANTWMAREAQRLGMTTFTFEDGRLMPHAKKRTYFDQLEITDYRESILQSFGPWLEKIASQG
jgi:hypothetical protein